MEIKKSSIFIRMKESTNINLIQIKNMLKILNLKKNSFIHIIIIEENEVIIWRNSIIINEYEN